MCGAIKMKYNVLKPVEKMGGERKGLIPGIEVFF